MFDRELCCKQLRYSGMMETIRIRRAGYPIRHTFNEFVERYRFLLPGIGPAHKVPDCKAVTMRVCASVLGKTDYQLGKTKVFLKDAHDLFLEQERDRVLTKKILTLQRAIRGWYHRRRFLRMRKNVIIIQRYWRGFIQKKKYEAVSYCVRTLFRVTPNLHMNSTDSRLFSPIPPLPAFQCVHVLT